MTDLNNLSVESLNGLTADQLKDPKVLGLIEKLASDPMYDYEPGQGAELYETLGALVDKYAGVINGTESYSRVKKIQMKVGWEAFQMLGNKFREQTLSEIIVVSMKNNTSVIDYLQKYLRLFEFGAEPDFEERQKLIRALAQNEETIGTQQVSLKTGESVRNTLGNWIKDYLGYIDPKSLSGVSYQMTQYFYSSPNVKTLSPGDKQLLSSVLGIYNLLKYPNYVPVIEKEEALQPAPIPVPKPVSVTRPPVPKPLRPEPQPVLSSVPTFKPTTSVMAKPLIPSAPQAVKEITAFEKKLAEVSAPPPAGHGADLEVLKHRMEAQVKPIPPPVVKNNPDLNKINSEIKREVSTPELPPHTEIPKQVRYVAPKAITAPSAPVVKPPAPVATVAPAIPIILQTPMPVVTPASIAPSSVRSSDSTSIGPEKITRPVSTFEATFSDIKNMDDLKKIMLSHLRRGPLDQQIQRLKTKIVDLALSNRVIPYYALTAFEESPLFRSYMAHGQAIFSGVETNNDLTKQEFEAIADLRKEIQRL